MGLHVDSNFDSDLRGRQQFFMFNVKLNYYHRWAHCLDRDHLEALTCEHGTAFHFSHFTTLVISAAYWFNAFDTVQLKLCKTTAQIQRKWGKKYGTFQIRWKCLDLDNIRISNFVTSLSNVIGSHETAASNGRLQLFVHLITFLVWYCAQ